MEKPFYAEGLRFACKRCSSCCRGEPGFVFLKDDDIAKLAEAVELRPEQFVKVYCRNIGAEISLKERRNFDCIFWKNNENGGGCELYRARPLQCRTFPFWQQILTSKKAWDAYSQHCPGMNSGKLYTMEEIDTILAQNEA
ncbi:MAG: YkgJ family cysteine cluster protein [Spirochaetaceae bacterium]|jgi:Fe-S-cluster containining protein|nr:YkgJ family cysteine cluster protein [Spirochaetaceae bacterium]